jgi:endonuclease/exonuclease/phosphatase family metal-dependent hydrolase
MTYNVHGCVGTDRSLNVKRVTQTIQRQAPDLVVLQELDVGRHRSEKANQAELIAEQLGVKSHFTCAVRADQEEYGIALLTGLGLSIVAEGPLPHRRDEVRAAQWARVARGPLTVDVVHTHLSIRKSERAAQVQTLLGGDWLEQHLSSPHLIVCGDLNATPYSNVYRSLARHLSDVQVQGQAARPRATWPSWLPLLRLDHIFVGSGFIAERVSVPRDRQTRVASDHLPVVVDLVAMPTEAPPRSLT